MNINVTFGQGDAEFPVDFGSTHLIKGDKGDDGISPTVDITPIDGGHRISITDADGTETADVMDGKDGSDGQDGRDGADGISPTVAVQDITGGHRVTITDKDGAQTFDVMDGKDGAGGSGGAAVQSDWSVNDESDPAYVKNRTHWMERPYEPIVWDGSTEGRDSVDVSLAMGYPAGSVIAYKISDHVLTKNEIETSTVHADGYMNGFQEVVDVVAGAIWQCAYSIGDDDGGVVESGTIICTIVAGDFSNIMGVVIPSTGTYSLPLKHSSEIEINGNVYHKIDAKYLPDSYATKEYVDGLIMGAIGGSY